MKKYPTDIPKGPELAAEPKPIVNDSAKVQNGKLFIILVTGFRTGSTFLGELFNQVRLGDIIVATRDPTVGVQEGPNIGGLVLGAWYWSLVFHL